MHPASVVLFVLLASCSSSSAPTPAPAAEELLEPLCPPQARAALPVPWRDLALPLPGGTLCANEPDFPEWKSGIQILHRGQAADKVPLREAYIAMFVAAGWTQVTRDESDPMKHVGTILHLHLQRADGTQALVGSIFASADRVHVDLQRLGWDDQRRNRQLEANKIVEDALEHAPARP